MLAVATTALTACVSGPSSDPGPHAPTATAAPTAPSAPSAAGPTVDDLVAAMPLRLKAAQVLFVSVHGSGAGATTAEQAAANEASFGEADPTTAIRALQPGGVVYLEEAPGADGGSVATDNLTTTEQVARLSADLGAATRFGLVVATAAEPPGGVTLDELGVDLDLREDPDLDPVRSTSGSGPDDAVAVLAEGADLLVLPDDPRATVAAIVAAVEEGSLPAARLDDAVRRVLDLKVELGILSVAPSDLATATT